MKKKHMYKIGDIPKDMNLAGFKLNGMVIFSGWNKGFWTKTDDESERIYPVFFKDFDEIKNWKVEAPLSKVLAIELFKKQNGKEK